MSRLRPLESGAVSDMTLPTRKVFPATCPTAITGSSLLSVVGRG